MDKKTKDALRYIILIAVSMLTYFAIQDIMGYAFTTKNMSNATAGLLSAISASILGVWGYIVKWFFQTKASD